MTYPDWMNLREAMVDFLRVNGYGEDGGVSAKWVKVVFEPLPLFVFIPNCAARRKALPLHDIHHIATGYTTNLLGEAEIAAWEIGGSCRTYWAAWMFNFMAFCYGCYLIPCRSFRAFVRGRRTKNLYDRIFRESMLNGSVGEMREKLGLDQATPHPTSRDRLAYVGWLTLAIFTDLAFFTALAAILLGLYWIIT